MKRPQRTVLIKVVYFFAFILSTAFEEDLLRSWKTSVHVNIHFEGCISKPPFFMHFVLSSVNGVTKTEV